jgi:DNA-binding LacI/PurR family transcriptional regulator
MKISQLKYKQIEQEIRELAKTLPAGAKLPSERDMAKTFDCNFLTVRKALKQLVDDGVITRKIGSGTFVSPQSDQISVPVEGGLRLGIMIWEESDVYGYNVLKAIAHAARTKNIHLRSCWINDFAANTRQQADRLKREGCVAIILPWFPHEKTEEVRHFVSNSPLPVTLPMLIPGLEKNCFEQQGSFGSSMITCTEMLCRYYECLGRKQIAFLGPNSSTDVILQNRLSAYSCHISQQNLPFLCGLVDPGAEAMDQLAERWKIHQGNLSIISYDDEHALRFMTAMHKVGLSAPTDFEIIGFNDIESSRYSDPPLSTICQSFGYIGEWLIIHAVAFAQNRVEQSPGSPRHRLLVRYSCGGRGNIDDALRAKLPNIDLVIDNGEPFTNSVPDAATPASDSASKDV